MKGGTDTIISYLRDRMPSKIFRDHTSQMTVETKYPLLVSAPPPERRWISFEKDVDKNTRGNRNWQYSFSQIQHGLTFAYFIPYEADPYRMRVFCYNVLAEVYAIPERHFYCPTWAIEWDYRKKLVIQEINKHNPDILCLQEVEAKQYREFFEPELSKLGYSGNTLHCHLTSTYRICSR